MGPYRRVGFLKLVSEFKARYQVEGPRVDLLSGCVRRPASGWINIYFKYIDN